MNVLLIEPMKEPCEAQIKPGLESLQRAVAGDIEAMCAALNVEIPEDMRLLFFTF